jgi:hypothetical protein
MSPGRIAAGRGRAVRVFLALTAVSACLGAAAFAATREKHPAAGLGSGKALRGASEQGADTPGGAREEAPPRARLIEYPEPTSTAAEVQFRFNVPPRAQRSSRAAPPGPPGEQVPARRFQCLLDGDGWRACSSPYRLGRLTLGTHAFAVRALARGGRPGPAADYSWRQVEPPAPPAQADPKPFSIELAGEIQHLLPGDPAQQLPILITNPNSVAIEVTGVTVAIAAEPEDCPAENFALTPSSLSPAAPLTVPAGGSAALPSAEASAPAIAMLNLAVNQDSCRGADVSLRFSGEARG